MGPRSRDLVAREFVGKGNLRLFQIRLGMRLVSSESTFLTNPLQVEREEGKGGI